MNIYLIEQSENQGYERFDSAVVCAPDEETARDMNPCSYWDYKPFSMLMNWSDRSLTGYWASSRDQVTVKLIGAAAPGIAMGVVSASFRQDAY
jgi:hypothetical protein